MPRSTSKPEASPTNSQFSGETAARGSRPNTSTNAVPFDFDEDNLSDEEDIALRLISFHKTQVYRCIENSQFDDEFHQHLSALVEDHKVCDTVLAVYFAVSLLRKEKSANRVLPLLSNEFKYVATVEPEINLAGYILRAQASVLGSEPASGLLDCRRAIKLVENYKTSEVGGKTKGPLFDRFRNSAYRIATLCSANLSSEVDRQYYRAMYQPDTFGPFLEMGTKALINLEFLDNNGKWMDITNVRPQSTETELEDDLLEKTRAQRFKGIDTGATISFQILKSEAPRTESFRSTMSRFGGVEKFSGYSHSTNPSRNFRFPQRSNVLELLQYCLKQGDPQLEGNMGQIARYICCSANLALHEGVFTFEHPLIDPFAYHPPYAGMTNTQILVDKAFTLVAESNKTLWIPTLYKYLCNVHENTCRAYKPALDIILESAFRIAISLDNTTFIKCVIENHPYKISLTDDSKGLIHTVIRSSWSGDTTILKQMLGQINPDVHNTLSNGGNIFHYAAYYSINHVSAMECLLDYHRCRECLLAKMTFRGSQYTPYQMASIARPKHRLFGDNEKLIGEIKALMEKLAGSWVKEGSPRLVNSTGSSPTPADDDQKTQRTPVGSETQADDSVHAFSTLVNDKKT